MRLIRHVNGFFNSRWFIHERRHLQRNWVLYSSPFKLDIFERGDLGKGVTHLIKVASPWWMVHSLKALSMKESR